MPTGITKTTDMTNSVTTVYEKAYYMMGMKNPGVWGQFIDWQEPISPQGGGGSSYDFPIYDEGDPVDTALTEDADVAPQTISDGNVTITPAEWGATFARTKKLAYQSRINMDKHMGEVAARHRVNTIDKVLRRYACGYGNDVSVTQKFLIDGAAVYNTLSAHSGADTVTWAWLQELQAYAASMGIEPLDSGGYVAIVHPSFVYDLTQLSEWKGYQYSVGPEINTVGLPHKPFTFGGITFVPSLMGRLMLGAGANIGATTAPTATTLNAAVNAGATSFDVASGGVSAAGIAVGDWITIGTVESPTAEPSNFLEQCLVTGVSTDTLTVRGHGKNGTFGVRYNHAAGESVTTGYNVAAIPLIGKNSLLGVYASDCGKLGKPTEKEGLDYLDRMKYYGWYWYGGVAAIQKHIVLGLCATSKYILGDN